MDYPSDHICHDGSQRLFAQWPRCLPMGTPVSTMHEDVCLRDRAHILAITIIMLCSLSWWSHQMETFSALLDLCAGNSPVTGELPSQKPVTRSFDVFFDLRLNKWLTKQSWGCWYGTPSRPLWCHCNDPLDIEAEMWQYHLMRTLIHHKNMKYISGAYALLYKCY